MTDNRIWFKQPKDKTLAKTASIHFTDKHVPPYGRHLGCAEEYATGVLIFDQGPDEISGRYQLFSDDGFGNGCFIGIYPTRNSLDEKIAECRRLFERDGIGFAVWYRRKPVENR